MRLMYQGPEKKCMIYSLAMLLNEHPDRLLEEFDYVDEPFFDSEPRSHHIQELIDCCIKRGVALLEVQSNPIMSDGVQQKPIWAQEQCAERLKKYMDNYDGLLHIALHNNLHMCAWSCILRCVFDPNGMTYQRDDVSIISFYAKIGCQK